jgi:pimeloyl-ACP methyl ester carboxylesterase
MAWLRRRRDRSSFPLDNGRTLAAEIPNAELLVLPENGHRPLARSGPLVIPALLNHTRERTATA